MRTQKFFGVEQAPKATGFVVVIDVFRAASTAACALDRGAKEIIPVITIEEAYAYKETHPSVFLMGEERGVAIPKFDYGNSPFRISTIDLTGMTMVHRTTQGTQGIVGAIQADTLIFGGFVTAHAIYSLIQQAAPEIVSFVVLAGAGTEDELFADYMIDLLHGKHQDMKKITQNLRNKFGTSWFFDPNKPEFPEEDFSFCLNTDVYPFAVVAVRTPYLHLVKRSV